MADDDFTDVDGQVATERLQRSWLSEFPDYDPTRASPDTRLFEEMGTVAERDSYYIDVKSREMFIDRAIERQSMLDLGVLIAFRPTTRVAARADQLYTLTRTVVPGARFLLSEGSQVRTASTSDPIVYEMLTDLEIQPDGESVQTDTITAENSERQSDAANATGVDFQPFLLTTTPFLDGSLVLTDDLSAFDVVDTFADSGPTDAHVTLRIDARERVTIVFGDSNTGRRPSGAINAAYRTGGGTFGEVEADQLVILSTAQFQDDDGNSVTLTTTNPSASTLGADRQTIEELRREIPQSAQTQRNAVTNEDFENGATGRIAGVARALGLTMNEAPALVPLNEQWVYIVPKGGGQATQALLDEVAELFSDDGALPAGNTIVVRVFQAPYKTVDVVTRVFVTPDRDRVDVRNAIAANLQAFFGPENVVSVRAATGEIETFFTVAFGFNFAEETGQPDGELSWAGILCEIETTKGVAKVDDTEDRLLLNGTDSDAALDLEQFPELGTVTVIDAATGTVIPEI